MFSPPSASEIGTSLPVARFTFQLDVLSPIIFSKNQSAVLRGAFGNALKKVTCTVPDTDCVECSLYRLCAYPYLFETPAPASTSRMPKGLAVPRPFVFDLPLEAKSTYHSGETLTFELVLIGRGIDYLPYFVRAFERMGQRGIGGRRGTFQIQAVDPVQEKTKEITHENRVLIRFLTPTRIVSEGRPTAAADFPLFFRTLFRRIENLRAFHGRSEKNHEPDSLPSNMEAVRTASKKLRWVDRERYSRRQRRMIPQGGFVGEIVFEGEMGPFLPYLKLGEAVHVGKGATFGMGRFEVGEVEGRDYFI